MKTIYKYTHPVAYFFEIKAPRNAELIKVGCDTNWKTDIAFWFIIETDEIEDTFSRGFYVVGTGQEIPKMVGPYIDSVHMGRCIWHVFGR